MIKSGKRFYLLVVVFCLVSVSCGAVGNLNGADVSNPSKNDSSNNNSTISTSSDKEIEMQPSNIQGNNREQNLATSSEDEGDVKLDLPFPVVDDAFNIEEKYGNFNYQTNLSVEDASEFYRLEMQALGYEIGEDVYTGTGTIFSFERSDSIVTMNVIQNDHGGVTINYAERTP